MTEHKPTLSVITVVFNDVNNIERTMRSVLDQSYPNIEYVIIDGASTDGTLEVINQFAGKLSKFISEKDKGIYDAMNKGLALATGDYILFMNSGDEIFSRDTVEKVFSTSPDADIYYGETEMIDGRLKSLGRRRHAAPESLTFKSFRFGMRVSHQAIYIKRSLAEPFDTTYQLSADIDWILKAIKTAKIIVNTKIYVARYLVGGMSKKKHKASLLERYDIFKKHYGLVPNLFHHIVIALNLGWYYLRYRKTND